MNQHRKHLKKVCLLLVPKCSRKKLHKLKKSNIHKTDMYQSVVTYQTKYRCGVICVGIEVFYSMILGDTGQCIVQYTSIVLVQ